MTSTFFGWDSVVPHSLAAHPETPPGLLHRCVHPGVYLARTAPPSPSKHWVTSRQDPVVSVLAGVLPPNAPDPALAQRLKHCCRLHAMFKVAISRRVVGAIVLVAIEPNAWLRL